MNPQFCLPNQDGKNVCLKDFEKLGVKVLGISPDSKESHCKFADKHKLKIELLSDADKKVIKQFGVWGKKKLYGKEYEGIIRSTFLISQEGKIAHEWKNVKVENHVEKVLEKIRELKKN